jgi:hypothetical protein
MEKVKLNIPRSREVCSGNPEEVRDVGLQGDGYTYGIKFEVVVGYDFEDCGCYFIQVDGGFIDKIDDHKTRYMFCCEHPELIYGTTQVGSFGCNKTYDEVP